MKKYIRVWIIWVIILILLVLIWKYWYDYYKYEMNVSRDEQENRKIDEYNFEQLEKVKSVLDWLDKNSYKFDNIKEFNKNFNQNIKPIKNCYFLTSRNWYFDKSKWWGWYIFWFKLTSDRYKNKYWVEYYAYPKYDLPIFKLCFWLWEWWCYDDNKESFIKTISNPCED